jgi:hypothetical protein
MADESFTNDLLRAVAAQLHLLNGLTVAREMFGKSYFSLGVSEKLTVDQMVMTMVAGNYQTLTPELLSGQKPVEQVGFVHTKTEQHS